MVQKSPFIFLDKHPRIVFLPTVLSLVLLVASLVLLAISFTQLPSEIPLFYSTETKVLVGKNLIFLMPGLILALALLNLAISKTILKWNFLAQILAVTTLFVSFLIFWAQLKVTFLF